MDILINSLRPIGILIDNLAINRSELFVYYPGSIFDALANKINARINGTFEILVSSANITTTSANTTADGVRHDFAFSKYVSGVVDMYDLKKDSRGNNSTTIIRCTETGLLSFYRIGYPSQSSIESLADREGITINLPPNVRETSAR